MLPVEELLNNIVLGYKRILNDNLVGIYLHGSLVMNCFNPKKSDIDFLVVVKEKISFVKMRELIDILLKYDGDSTQKGFEMSIILEKEAKNFRYPTPFLLHYSNFHKEKYLKDSQYICGGFEDTDLAAHMMITREFGKCLYGENINQVFGLIPKKYYVESIICDIEGAKEEISENPTYYILNLCRVLYYLKEEVISSKKQGGMWALKSIPDKYKEVVELALQNYSIDKELNCWNNDRIDNFVGYMLKEIKHFLLASDSVNYYV